ncbi:SRPBCC family protein [Paenibacillus validus]|uniref:Cell division protein n=1 Tax=Paenibacillus validus TaxID=44253 RepID=A0A7X2ZBI7_9BACL|nr:MULTISPECIES: SRPBCC family protein [Paenibacillus]MED4604110.1 SRPBCC family protein [Paenibacillus validus]MED4609772.1 SRPBCC family protein [Paenibacillus validus]MUG71898.1 cell division protein [Paenibacillus validus]
MPVIRMELFIEAPPELCFDLARSIDVHMLSMSGSQERAIGGRTSGLIELGETVTWEAVHFGVRQQLTAKITEMDKPHRFVDEMVKGAFARFYHEHTFMPEAEGTRMTDTFDYTSPCGPLGWLADAWFLERYMRRLLAERNAVVKRLAEEQVVATEKIHSDMKRSSKRPF